MSHRFVAPLLVLLSLILSSHNSLAAPKYLFKIATLAPEGSVWINQFKEFSQEVTDKTGGEVGFKIYPGGIMGDDQAMYRKMRVGQLHGGGFTMTGIAAVVPDFRVMSIPFLFKDYGEVDAVKVGLLPLFQQRFADKGMAVIALTEVGFIYPMSTKAIATTADLRQATIWIPSGDPLAEAFFGQLKMTPVQLSIPDVLSSLQTGLVNTVFNSLYGAIVFQWFTKTKWITETPFGYAYGVFLLDGKKFGQLPPGHAEIVRRAAASHFAALLTETRKSNEESRQVMVAKGVQFSQATPDFLADLAKTREAMIAALIDTAFSREIYEKTIALLEQYRAQAPVEPGK